MLYIKECASFISYISSALIQRIQKKTLNTTITLNQITDKKVTIFLFINLEPFSKENSQNCDHIHFVLSFFLFCSSGVVFLCWFCRTTDRDGHCNSLIVIVNFFEHIIILQPEKRTQSTFYLFSRPVHLGIRGQLMAGVLSS